MYSTKTGLIFGFHGCDESVRDDVAVKKGVVLTPSCNDYDWLGSGVYFWENNYFRALEFARFLKTHPHHPNHRIEKPSVIGAVIDLGYCLDLLDSDNLNLLKAGYDLLAEAKRKSGYKMPQNVPLGKDGDLLLRYFDRAVIEQIHEFNKRTGRREYDSVRGVFFEGQELYENAGFREKNHIQIAIRNPNCIKGYFIPRELDQRHPKI